MSVSRRIQCLRLRGGDEGALSEMRRHLHEAFRCASLPGLPANALVLVRRLDLGRLPRHASPALLARHIDAQVSALPLTLLHPDDGEQADAQAVCFAGLLEAYAALLARLLDARPLRAWYWHRLLPRSLAPEERAGAVLLAAGQGPAAGLGVAQLVDAVLRPGRINALLEGLEPAGVERLARLQGQAPARAARPGGAGFSADGFAPDTGPSPLAPDPGGPGGERRPDDPIAPPPARGHWPALVQAAVRRWGEDDGRSRWLALQALLLAQPLWLRRDEAWSRLPPRAWLRAWTETAALSPPPARPAHISGKPAASAWRLGRARGRRARAGAGVAGMAIAHGPETAREQPRVAGFAATPQAGLALLIPLWQRVGLGQLLAANEALVQAEFHRHLLHQAGRHAGLAEYDPQQGLLRRLPAPGEVAERGFHAPECWWLWARGRPLRARVSADGRYWLSAAAGHWPLFCGPAEEAMALARHYRAPLGRAVAGTGFGWAALAWAVHYLAARYLRRHAGLNLRGLINRPGGVALSRSHWEARFALSQADIRLRRLGLDCDPGWVPWLGKVVQFHYLEAGRS